MAALLLTALIALAVVLLGSALSFRIVRQHERGTLFRLGRFSRRNGSSSSVGPA
jgi:regulator of protease activity HflC (stomatin/prohibitin superfamily)